MLGADHHGPHFAVDADGTITRFDTLQGLEVGPDEGTAGLAVGRVGTLYYGVHPAGLVAGDRTGFMEMLEASESSELRAFDPRTGEERTVAPTLTTAEIHEGDLYVGSIEGDWIARCRLGLSTAED